MEINWNDFEKIDLRVGTIIEAEYFEEAIKPAIKVRIDFGKLGLKKSSAQITEKYKPSDIIGKQIVAVVNFPPKQIASMMSECLILGSLSDDGVTLLTTEGEVENGSKIS